MNTNVIIKTGQGLTLGAVVKVGIHAGDTVTFRADGGPALLGFPGHTAKILSPKPAHSVTLANGEHLTLTFLAADPGNYVVLTLPKAGTIPDTIDADQSDASGATLLVMGRKERPTPQSGDETQPVFDPGTDPNVTI